MSTPPGCPQVIDALQPGPEVGPHHTLAAVRLEDQQDRLLDEVAADDRSDRAELGLLGDRPKPLLEPERDLTDLDTIRTKADEVKHALRYRVGGQIADDLRWYFEQRRSGGSTESLLDDDERAYRARLRRFSGIGFSALYTLWLAHGNEVFTRVSAPISHALAAGDASIEPLVLPHATGRAYRQLREQLNDWQRAGVWDRLHELLLSELHQSDRIDWSRAVVDSGSVRAVGAGEKTGPNPTDRRKPGSKHHVLTDGNGVPLQVQTSAANTHDIKRLLPLVVNIPKVRGKRGRPRSRPRRMYADRAYDDEGTRTLLRWLGITPYLAKRGTEHGSGLGKYRYVVERTISWLHGFRRLRVRYDRDASIHDGFLKCAACMVCLGLLL